MSDLIRVTVWNEFRHEKTHEAVQEIYPDGMHATIAGFLGSEPHMQVRTATLDEPEHGLTEQVLNETDVLTWWGHMAHQEVRDEIVDRVQEHVLSGMGLLVFHSGHFSKIHRRMLGTTANLKWREIGEKERLWVVAPGHPIADGLGEYIELANTEMYGEFFDIPQPDEQVFISWFEEGEVFRSGNCYYRGRGRMFYFRPGHETFPVYKNEEIQRVIKNAVRWAAPVDGPEPVFGNVKPLEDVGE
ncbi:MAG: ThuA domain-containing protein [Planctomycetota bacterium]